jgi:hypothetical protein
MCLVDFSLPAPMHPHYGGWPVGHSPKAGAGTWSCNVPRACQWILGVTKDPTSSFMQRGTAQGVQNHFSLPAPMHPHQGWWPVEHSPKAGAGTSSCSVPRASKGFLGVTKDPPSSFMQRGTAQGVQITSVCQPPWPHTMVGGLWSTAQRQGLAPRAAVCLGLPNGSLGSQRTPLAVSCKEEQPKVSS